MAKIYWQNLDPDMALELKSAVDGVLTPDGITIVKDSNGVISVVEGSGGDYELPKASDTVLGGVKIDGTTITIDNDGVISAIVGVPLEIIDDLTTGGTDKVLSAEQGKVLKGLLDTLTARVSGVESDLSTHEGLISDKNTLGHMKIDDTTIKINASNEAYVVNPFSTGDKTKLDGIDVGANKYELPMASDNILGGVKVDNTSITINSEGVISAVNSHSLPQVGAFTTTVKSDVVNDFVYTPTIPINPTDELLIFYNSTALSNNQWSIEDDEGVNVIVLNVEEAEDITKNSVSGFIMRGFGAIQ